MRNLFADAALKAKQRKKEEEVRQADKVLEKNSKMK
jgi:hypothetical protein|tara:strand:- start:239 stop:346 length:108 start_codon:yes stop_codon:yes gene_type:complete